MTGRVLHIQRFSLYDGPGVRTVVFLKGCPLRCLWCHNPEGLEAGQQILFNSSKCIGCMDCATACPQGCHQSLGQGHIFRRESCQSCGRCAAACCSGALTLTGQDMTPEEVLRQVLRDRGMYGQNGGLTLSGGEPLAQGAFSLELLRLAKAESLHTCIETSGFAPAETLAQIAAFTDLFLYDYKATDPETHKKLCGVSNEKILSNLRLLEEMGKDIILRCPIIPGCNDDPAHILGIARVAVAHSCIRKVELEPYHRLGVSKLEQLGLPAGFDTTPPDKATMEQYRQIIAQHSRKDTVISG